MNLTATTSTNNNVTEEATTFKEFKIMSKDWELIESFTSEAGLKCLVVLINRLPSGSWYCGYVVVPNDCQALSTGEFRCHGGVTYRDSDYILDSGQSLIGFDMAHSGDDVKCPKPTPGLTAYVRAELESLARQIADYVSPDKALADLENQLWEFIGQTVDEDWSNKLSQEAAMHYVSAKHHVNLAIACLELSRITDSKE